ncbi:MAG: hypothetical protein ACAI18_00385 [Gemmatimonadales bacterium]
MALFSGRLLGERVGRHLWLVVAMAFLGIVLLVRPSFHSASPVPRSRRQARSSTRWR